MVNTSDRIRILSAEIVSVSPGWTEDISENLPAKLALVRMRQQVNRLIDQDMLHDLSTEDIGVLIRACNLDAAVVKNGYTDGAPLVDYELQLIRRELEYRTLKGGVMLFFHFGRSPLTEEKFYHYLSWLLDGLKQYLLSFDPNGVIPPDNAAVIHTSKEVICNLEEILFENPPDEIYQKAKSRIHDFNEASEAWAEGTLEPYA